MEVGENFSCVRFECGRYNFPCNFLKLKPEARFKLPGNGKILFAFLWQVSHFLAEGEILWNFFEFDLLQ